MNLSKPLAWLGVMTLVAFAASQVRGADTIGKPVRNGDVRTEQAISGVLFYYLPEPVGSTDAAAFQAIKRNLGRIEVTTEPISDEMPPVLELIEEKRPLKNFIIPQPSYLAGLGRGLDAKQIQAIQGSTRVTRMLLVTTSKDALKQNAQLVKAAHEYATETRAAVLDITTRECFSLEAWKRLRADEWGTAGEVPDMSTQVLIAAYAPHKDSNLLRAATLGMEKFALPDFCVEDFEQGESVLVTSLLELVIQLVAESPRIADSQRFAANVATVKSAKVKARLNEIVGNDGKGTATLALVYGDRHGDGSEHPMYAIDFRHGAGTTPAERRAAVLNQLWGAVRK
jgi:hypothetical protein